MDGIGALRRRLSLQAESVTPDGAGGGAATWSEIARVFAAVEGLDGGEDRDAMRRAGRTRFRVTLRHRDDVAVGQRFVDGALAMIVRGAFDPDGTRRRLVCLCEAAP